MIALDFRDDRIKTRRQKDPVRISQDVVSLAMSALIYKNKRRAGMEKVLGEKVAVKEASYLNRPR